MKKKWVYILIFALIASTIACLAVTFVYLIGAASGDDTYTIEVDDIKSEELKFAASGLRPGVTKEFTLFVKSELGGEYTIKFDFKDSTGGKLNEFLMVMIESDEYTETSKLTDLFDKTIEFGCNIKPKSKSAIKIRYFLDREVGNEAQGATADFDLIVDLERKIKL